LKKLWQTQKIHQQMLRHLKKTLQHKLIQLKLQQQLQNQKLIMTRIMPLIQTRTNRKNLLSQQFQNHGKRNHTLLLIKLTQIPST